MYCIMVYDIFQIDLPTVRRTFKGGKEFLKVTSGSAYHPVLTGEGEAMGKEEGEQKRKKLQMRWRLPTD